MGDKFSIADAYFFVVSSWTAPTEIGLQQWPHIADFSTRMMGRESVQQAMRAEGLLN